MPNDWDIKSWKKFEAAQQPPWPDQAKLDSVLSDLSQQPALVFAGEVRELKQALAQACRGDAFLLQGGDCAEQFAYASAPVLREKLKILLQMAVVLTWGSLKPVIKVGRIAGQYGKPRSKPTETVDGEEVVTFRGDNVNGLEATLDSRTPDPDRLMKAYYQSAATLNLLRAYTHGGFADLSRVHAWNLDFIKESRAGHEYEEVSEEIRHALEFIKAIGVDSSALHRVDFFTSHEALLLDYETSLSRVDSLTGDWYNCAAHMLWIGDRTRQLDGAHVEYMRGIKNPIGLKVGPSCSKDDLLGLIEKLNPYNEPGRLVLITRFGSDKIGRHLPPLLRAVKEEGSNVVWSCDPMHGNTFTAGTGHKTRHFDNILDELTRFFQLHKSEGTIPGGVHFELTGENVTECLGGGEHITEEELHKSYETACDPRLNAKQSLELAFKISKLLKERR